MRAIILILILTISVVNISQASIYSMMEHKLFGMREVKDSIPEIEAIVLKKIDSLKTAETVEGFVNFIRIKSKYVFDELPCLMLCTIEDGMGAGYPEYRSYKSFLYNTCDSVIYPLDGCGPRFCRVIKRYLPVLFKEKKFIDLIILYLGTLSSYEKYYVLCTIKDYEDIWAEYEDDGAYVKDDIEEDIWRVSRVLKKPRLNERESPYDISLYTWNRSDRNIEFWKFRMSENVFEVLSRTTHLARVGPIRLGH